jgi:biopolymer transport protein ExbD
MEKRLNLIATCGNIATLLGLMGTIYGLILAFAAVGQPGIPPTQKSSMLATGISAAMNTTLLGLIIAVPCVLMYSLLRARIDRAIGIVDLYAVSIIKALIPADVVQKSYKVSDRRTVDEIDVEPDIVPFMNLMVVLIPLLLSSSEFVKIGMIDLKLPESSVGLDGGNGANDAKQDLKLELGIVITKKGFNLFHFFKDDKAPTDLNAGASAEIPVKNNEYDYETLANKLADVKQKALLGIFKEAQVSVPENASLVDLARIYREHDFSRVRNFVDFNDIKIVAEDSIKYNVVIGVMDAARGLHTENGNATMFPNVSIAGGIVQ